MKTTLQQGKHWRVTTTGSPARDREKMKEKHSLKNRSINRDVKS